jgi:hypothetical protein
MDFIRIFPSLHVEKERERKKKTTKRARSVSPVRVLTPARVPPRRLMRSSTQEGGGEWGKEALDVLLAVVVV